MSDMTESLSRLSPEIWAEVLHYLPPNDMAAFSSSSLLAAANGVSITQRAAWLALGSELERATQLTSMLLSRDLPVLWEVLTTLDENQETFLGLYNLFFHLCNGSIEAINRRTTNTENNTGEGNNDGQDAGEMETTEPTPEKDTTMTGKTVAVAALWLLFGAPKSPTELIMSPNDAAAETISAWYKARVKTIGQVLIQQMTPSGGDDGMAFQPTLGISSTRILQIVLRLGDVGHWDIASKVLLLAEGSFKKQKGSTMATDSKIYACKFRVDRVYSNTYVSADDGESRELIDAVNMGREAVQQSLQMMAADASVSVNDTKEEPSNDAARAAVRGRPSAPPTALKSLFPTPLLRLGAARLALIRSLASLAQHVGIGATDPSQYPIRLSSGGTSTDPRDVSGRLFQEGLQVAETTLAELNADDQVGAEANLDTLEVQAATLAARGELLYCAASANTRGPIRVVEDNTVLNIEAMLQKSIEALKASFFRVGRELANDIKPHGLSVASWCTHAPRSLMVLQCQTAKDLGKVCDFTQELRAYGIIQVGFGTDEEAKQFLSFAYVTSLWLYGKSHPSTSNIQRLRSGFAHQNVEPSPKESEVSVDVWLNEQFGSERMAL